MDSDLDAAEKNKAQSEGCWVTAFLKKITLHILRSGNHSLGLQYLHGRLFHLCLRNLIGLERTVMGRRLTGERNFKYFVCLRGTETEFAV